MVIQFVLIPFVRKIIFVLVIIDITFVIYWMYICLLLDFHLFHCSVYLSMRQ